MATIFGIAAPTRRRCRARLPLGRYRPRRSAIRLERVGQTDDGFRRAQHEEAVRFHRLGETVEDVDLGVLIEIDQDVAAEDDVECPELGKVVQQIELPVLHHGADVGVDLPELSRLLEIFDQQLDRQAALHLELAVDAGPRISPAPPATGRWREFRPASRRARQPFPSGTSPANTAPARSSRRRTRSGSLLRLARAFSSSGMIISRKWSNGTLSRKKKVSLVVMASTTCAT